jgi:hypothetical protein
MPRRLDRASSGSVPRANRLATVEALPADILRAVRRGTAITLIVLFVLLVAAVVGQLRQHVPSQPYPGPVSGTELPPTSPTPTGLST